MIRFPVSSTYRWRLGSGLSSEVESSGVLGGSGTASSLIYFSVTEAHWLVWMRLFVFLFLPLCVLRTVQRPHTYYLDSL